MKILFARLERWRSRTLAHTEHTHGHVLNGMLQRAVSGAKQLPRRKRVCLVIICLAVGLAVGPAVGLAVGLSIQ